MSKITGVSRVSIVPFDLEDFTKYFDPDNNESQREKLEEFGFKNLTEKNEDDQEDEDDQELWLDTKSSIKKLVGVEHWRLEYHNSKNHNTENHDMPLKLYITQKGIGIAVVTKKYGDDLLEKNTITGETADRLLTDRKGFHKEILEGIQEENQEEILEGIQEEKILKGSNNQVRNLIGHLFESVAPKKPKVANNKLKIDYVFTYFIISHDGEGVYLNKDWFLEATKPEGFLDDDLSEAEFKRSILALLSPSYFATENRPEAIRKFELTKDSFPNMEEIDPRTNVCTLASWSGLVIIADNTIIEDAREITSLYEHSEVRTQLAWSISYKVRELCKEALESNKKNKTLDEQRKNLPLLRTFLENPDAEISGRDSAILQGLRNTSRLQNEIEATREMYGYLEEQEDNYSNKRMSNAQGILNITIFIFTILSLIPIFYDLPLISELSLKWLLLIIGAPLLLAFLLNYLRQKRILK